MVYGCQKDDVTMATGELEKITINMAPVDLGQIDLLVREGFYQNRTDFIRTAVRNQRLAATRARAGCAARHPPRPGGGARGRREAPDPGPRPREHRRRRLPRVGPGDNRLARGAWRLQGEPGRKVGAGGADPIVM